MFSELVRSARSIRNFDPASAVSDETLLELIDNCRYVPSTANKQPLKFARACTKERCEVIFPLLHWAGYLEDKPPYDGLVPTAYIIICADENIMKDPFVDEGICAQTIVLGAKEKGLGACMLGAFDKQAMASALDLPGHILPLLVIALGAPAETVEITDMKDGDVRYFRPERFVNVVPKRPLDEILL